MKNYICRLSNEKNTIELGKQLGNICFNCSANIYLYGDIGVGKTTFVRGFLNAIGYYGLVKSPTYTFIESYTINNNILHHIDLYRITNENELDFIDIYEYFDNNTICIVEWPQRGNNILPLPDLALILSYSDNERESTIIPYSSVAINWINQLCNIRN
ncbi:tRNA (adenosine(37)-N6)-threonylcarbamoyltransferase complex ATPase subunit type 1 TsaE [Candidatus Pantoea edessiphila]|uniref:tRNA threonylcarbamoyladenosine biosynthesis protein TsaE n=1 Tax=Candidatus Pantoea edessiphila TaxID=2044610 RepID=A0A2P5SXU5_9GAMM|nr:tRNA (adenosine(37)-N6)-threonylcarbamoyltransferase complex ATPase subunit type 1 TsaE [Candidatus Pantoea edessiphila]MBK4775725.1 tRNA (adenosine(37)-N6)-threonylcarbamoyltransferase complex ATPase subunit type 1 TsaE [Pantoea sp. Edef]PPI87122.1 tRNA (adenosine(37)-N6)-threonylcarbamoyltransferase complex ATPase subunit type 1 TsaE [Candidatus Pantoea edessiphila]